MDALPYRKAGDDLPPVVVFVDDRAVTHAVIADPARGRVLQWLGLNGRRRGFLYRSIRGVVTYKESPL